MASTIRFISNSPIKVKNQKNDIQKHYYEKLFLLFLLAYACNAFAQIKITDRQKSAADFPLHANGKSCNIQIDTADYEVVNKVAHLFAEDIERVTGVKGTVSTSKSVQGKKRLSSEHWDTISS